MKKAKKEIKERKIEKVKSEGDEKKGNILDIINSLNNKKVKVLKKVKRRKRPNNNLGVRFGRKSLQTIRNLGVEGNKLSKGENLLEGRVILEEENLRVLSEYISKITKSIRSYWKLPEYLKNNNYRCEIQIFISGDGSLRGLNIKKKSGNDEFDKRVMQTIKMAAPFPLVDKTISKKVLSGDLILGFSEDGIL